MTTLFYTSIRPAIGQTEVEVIRKAHVLGYELVPFNGWDNADFSTRKTEIKENRLRLNEIQNACELNGDWPFIDQCQDEPPSSTLEDDEALGMLHRMMGESNADI